MPRTDYFHPRYGIVLVKRGFSWPAFFFGALWAAAKRMWLVFFLMGPPDLALWFVTGYAQGQKSAALAAAGLLGGLAYAYVCGRYGNRWLEASLRRRGYVQEHAAAAPQRTFIEPTL